MTIPREIIEDIISRNDIVDLISSYVNLKRAGSNFNGLCPFHSEKTPSFTVFPASQSFYCFGCGAGGDAITFIMKSENLEYIPALEFLAARTGLRLSFDNDTDKTNSERKKVLEMNLAAAKYFRACLFDSNIGKNGMDYLVRERKLSEAVIKHFGLGFAPDGFRGLTEHMKGLGYKDDELVRAFLCGKSQKTGKVYDYFRNRIMFPIIDTSGNVIAFGGRVMDDSKPKYLNSSDTAAFKKSKNLFALNFARRHCSEQLILCEGYMDVIALHAAGFENAVATLGTALTAEQSRIMAKYTKEVIISYDSDGAGQKAANRATEMFSNIGLEAKILKIEGAKDPDEYIKKFGADEFRRLLSKSRTGFEFKSETILSKYDISKPSDKVKAAEEFCEYISDIWSEVERDVYISSVAQMLRISAEGLKNDVEKARKKKINIFRKKESSEAKMNAMGIKDRINTYTAINRRAVAAEETIIGLLLIYEEYRTGVITGKYEISGEDFISEFNRRVFEKTIECQKNDSFSMSLLGQFFTPDEMGRIQSMEVKRKMLTENGSNVLEECIEALKKEKSIAAASENKDSINEIQKLIESKRAAKDKNTNV